MVRLLWTGSGFFEARGICVKTSYWDGHILPLSGRVVYRPTLSEPEPIPISRAQYDNKRGLSIDLYDL